MNTGEVERVDTATQILDVAERLVQVRGFNGFSYADVAAELKITKAALHYHFAGKAELGEALVVRYAARFAEALAGVEAALSRCARQARCLRRSLPRRAARATHVSVRDDGGRVPDPPGSNAGRRCPILRRERAMARGCLGERPEGGNAHVRRAAKRDGPDDRQRPGRGDARGEALRRYHAISECRPTLALRTPIRTNESSSFLK